MLWMPERCPCLFCRVCVQVVASGGLLVLGTSLQEGERIELQLRGRAGRQGDPGTTQLMFDVSDPLITNFGMQSEYCAWLLLCLDSKWHTQGLTCTPAVS
jgi:preprotein translocase subunit SecA